MHHHYFVPYCTLGYFSHFFHKAQYHKALEVDTVIKCSDFERLRLTSVLSQVETPSREVLSGYINSNHQNSKEMHRKAVSTTSLGNSDAEN
jgi:hypothetical protein